MYFEEKIINGKLCWRGDPKKEFEPYTDEEIESKWKELNRANTFYNEQLTKANEEISELRKGINKLKVYEMELTGRDYMKSESMELNGQDFGDDHVFGYVYVDDLKKLLTPKKKGAMAMKYIVYGTNEYNEEMIIFPLGIAHTAMARGYEIVSAGFVNMDSDGKPHCHGRSASLDVDSRHKIDTDLLIKRMNRF